MCKVFTFGGLTELTPEDVTLSNGGGLCVLDGGGNISFILGKSVTSADGPMQNSQISTL